MCGHESPAGSSFCLNCGSSLAQAYAPTQLPAQGLPSATVCSVCRGENPPGMKFCRSCGSALAPVAGGFGVRLGAPPGPMPSSQAALGGPMPGMASGPIGGFPQMPPSGAFGGLANRGAEALQPTIMPASNPAIAPPPIAPPMGPPMGSPMGSPMGPPIGPIGGSLPPMGAPPRAQGSTIACPRCGTQTPLGFAFCQQCGFHLEAVASTESGPRGGTLDAPIDPHAGTLAQDDPASVAVVIRNPAAPRPQAAGAWGTAVLVNRDGSDGPRYPLSGEYLIFGRAGADIAFDDDRFLARQHARLERGGDGAVRIHPIDTLNGVFRKTDSPVALDDGTTILVGREVLRFERVDAEEAKVYPLVRHGVALFGSPPREPWGRLVQIVPSGGYRDVRHLSGEEIVLGREEGDIVFRDDAFLSRRHAAVTWDGKRAQITDLGSSNGTFVRITGPTVLRNGDHVRMGDQLLRIELGR
jgi:pSer/pThr/pTyr-binding forkhead associated (FHA) protein